MSKFPNIYLIKNKRNLGFTGANNIGIKKALKEKFHYIMLLNNDTLVNKDFIEPLLNSFDGDTAAVQPLIMNYPDVNKIWNYGGKINKFFGTAITSHKSQLLNKEITLIEKKTDWISGCCFVIKSSVINKVGLLDDKFFVYFEDVDWSIRLAHFNFTLKIIPESIIYHHESASWKSKNKTKEGYISPKTHYLSIRNHLYLIRKHNDYFNFIGSTIYQIFKISSYSIYFIMRFRFNKLRMVFKGFIDSFKL